MIVSEDFDGTTPRWLVHIPPVICADLEQQWYIDAIMRREWLLENIDHSEMSLDSFLLAPVIFLTFRAALAFELRFG